MNFNYAEDGLIVPAAMVARLPPIAYPLQTAYISSIASFPLSYSSGHTIATISILLCKLADVRVAMESQSGGMSVVLSIFLFITFGRLNQSKRRE